MYGHVSNPSDERHPTGTFCEDGVDHVSMGQTWMTLSINKPQLEKVALLQGNVEASRNEGTINGWGQGTGSPRSKEQNLGQGLECLFS